MNSATTEIRKGLTGVVVDYTAISKVNPDTNSLLYRGYPVQELAAKCSFEEVAYLLWNGDLPTPEELVAFTRQERAGRALDPAVKQVVDALPVTAHPMDVCRTAASVMGARHALAEDSTREANMAKAVDLFAAMPAVVAYDQRRRRGQDLVEPREDLGYSANFLWMSFGEEAVPEVVEAFDVSMILYAEHSFNASTFTARVVTSTLSDFHSAVTAAIGALKGPLHGGANEAVMHTFEEIGIRSEESLEDAAARAKSWMENALAQKKKVMGFGHRVYKHGDSRVPTMKAALDQMIAHYARPELLGLYNGLEQAMEEAKAIKPNLDYPAGPTYHLMGFDTQMFTPIFVASRITGWTAHIMEQAASNSLIRPLSAYNGVEERSL
ncbi:bifunctional 2-methylcitrate synthase/citrate synthase [Paenarthrobacter aurescens]|jgi:2-methylcitrate synthase/citrate synthase II|uniref:Citrate synthase n=1 Tax=Paenarthrobacter aurescens (strain TC1) TaxID=290340 RepID=A1RDJ6_PAEAT|nr:bifunctional 2-methylcitrate synthase/citrate synthase [Paenarthrobacter aurescens]ABM10688.1 citrate synthase [Paenarthrobacter aurescens TC1]